MSGGAAIALVLVAMLCISANDVAIRLLSDGHPLHQMVFVRSSLGMLFTLVILRLEGGWRLLRTRRPGLQALRAGLIVVANLTYFAALTVLDIATATALFFVAPLFITLLSIPLLGAKVGPHRLGAVAVGFAGVLLIMAPGGRSDGPLWAYALPVLAALCYAGMQILTRKLGAETRASAFSFYIQAAFILVAGAAYLALGDGRYAEGVASPTLVFLLRAWVWPEGWDLALFLLLGVLSGVIGFTLAQAYRLGEAATVSAYEYAALPLAILWGWTIWGEVPAPRAWAGIAMILAAGIYVFLREGRRAEPLAAARPLRRG